MSDAPRLRVGVLASGRGSNLRAILSGVEARRIRAEVVVVLSDRSGAGVLDIARDHGVEALVLDPTPHPGREGYDRALIALLEERRVGLVCLAGYMRILSPVVVRHFEGRLLNIHPALLPAFPGLHAQRQALEHGVRIAGATVHFVDEGVDTGPIVLQAAVSVRQDDTEATLSDRILAEEHRIYPEAIRLFAEGRLRLEDRRVRILEEP